MSEAGSGNVYEAALAGLAAAAGTGAGSEKSGQPPLRPSAAVVPWRRTAAGGIEVYWVKRGEALAFMGGWHAFPGGALSRSDAEIPVLPPEPAAPDLAPGILACAIRELFEETGILLARPAAGDAGAGLATE